MTRLLISTGWVLVEVCSALAVVAAIAGLLMLEVLL